jgi:hypothetical protein
MARDETKKRGNYDSGEDYVLEYGELRFTFNEEDFRQRVEQAAVKLRFLDPGLESDELEDLVNLTVNGEIREPVSPLGQHVNDRWYDLVGPADRSLVHWLRRLVFRGAWSPRGSPPPIGGSGSTHQRVVDRTPYRWSIDDANS